MVLAMLIIVANVILRIPWKPLSGTVELVEMAGAILLALGVAYTAMTKGHIMVGILVDRFPPRIRGFVDLVITSISLFFSFILARELVVLRNQHDGERLRNRAPENTTGAFYFYCFFRLYNAGPGSSSGFNQSF
jgi:TRAP-type mannitol/chloroaromatic compound transport system permease small subunit